MPRLTIFTPTYNRAHTLRRAYESLQKQTSRDFCWLIIDDGSTDDTKELIQSFIDENNDFTIQYCYKENGGLHTGYNKAIELCETELMLCLDSDDWLAPECVEHLLERWDGCPDRTNYAGVIANDCFQDGTIIGREYEKETTSYIAEQFLKVGYGDKALMMRTDLFKAVAPQVGFEGEKNFNPSYMIDQVAEKYDFLTLNESVKIVEYAEDGMASSIIKQYYNSPKSFMKYRTLRLGFKGAPAGFLIKNAIHYDSSCILAGQPGQMFHQPNHGLLCILMIPAGALLASFIRHQVRAGRKGGVPLPKAERKGT